VTNTRSAAGEEPLSATRSATEVRQTRRTPGRKSITWLAIEEGGRGKRSSIASCVRVPVRRKQENEEWRSRGGEVGERVSQPEEYQAQEPHHDVAVRVARASAQAGAAPATRTIPAPFACPCSDAVPTAAVCHAANVSGRTASVAISPICSSDELRSQPHGHGLPAPPHVSAATSTATAAAQCCEAKHKTDSATDLDANATTIASRYGSSSSAHKAFRLFAFCSWYVPVRLDLQVFPRLHFQD
jgi:hypothetical protein